MCEPFGLPSGIFKAHSGRGYSRAEIFERAQARINAIRAEKLCIDAIYFVKERDLKLVIKYFQSIEIVRAAKADCPRRKFQQNQREFQAFQAKANRLDHKTRARLLQFQSEERTLH